MESDISDLSILETCSFIKRNGERCQTAPLHGSALCFFHDPQVITERLAARRRGGLARHGPRGEAGEYVISSPQDVLGILTDALNDVYALSNTTSRAKTIGYLSQIILKGYEQTALEARLSAVEERLNAKK